MIHREKLTEIAQARIRDADILLASGRHDSAVYLCGYAIELALKTRICQTLSWKGYPSTNADFRSYQSFKTHDLDVLLHLTGREERIKTNLFTEWSIVAAWNPEARYERVGTVSKADAQAMLSAAKKVAKGI